MTGAYGRRRILEAVVAGSAVGLAGCGYRPGGGELAWETRVGTGTTFPGRNDDERWLAGNRLLRVRNRNGRTYDHDAGRWVDVEDAQVSAYDSSGDRVWTGETDRQFAGVPAVGGGSVYVPLTDGRVTAVARTGEVPGEIRWTSDRLGSEADPDPGTDPDSGPDPDSDDGLALAAGDGLVVAVSDGGLAGLDAGSGDRRFAVQFEGGSIDGVADVVVADDRVWTLETDRETLRGFDADGGERVDRSLSSAARWLAATADSCIVGLGDGVAAVESDGSERWQRDLGGSPAPPAVVDDRLYHVADGTLTAVDGRTGEPIWDRDASFSARDLVADEDGVYAYAVGSGDCRFRAVTSEGASWWSVPALEDLDCSGDLFLVEDRLVVRRDDTLYGFYKQPGDRYSVL